jgi:hypothetical protein
VRVAVFWVDPSGKIIFVPACRMMSSEDLMNSEASSPSRVSALALCKAYGLVVSRTLGAYTSSQLNPFPSRSAVTSSQNWAVVVNRPGGNSVMLPRLTLNTPLVIATAFAPPCVSIQYMVPPEDDPQSLNSML